MIVTPKDAATVILLRKVSVRDEGDFEVLMVLRHPKSSFVPNSYVFPGGIFEEGDYTQDIEELCTGMDQEKARSLLEGLSSPEIALGAWVAGIRETFEEVGMLLAYRSDGSLLKFDSPDTIDRFRTHRRLLIEGKSTLNHILREEGLTLATDRLHYFSHWITPVSLPLRYDVRFLVTVAPEEQNALHDGVELTEHSWISPREALDRFKEGKFNMVLPTFMTIKELSIYKTIDDIIRVTKGKKIEGILTRMVKDGGKIIEVMPDGGRLPRSVQ